MHRFWDSIYSPNYITRYNPFLLKNMNKAIDYMVDAINNRKKIVVYGIQDVDGLCAISSLWLLLKYLNADIEYIVHDGVTDGFITAENIKNNVSFLGGQLLITLGIDLHSTDEEELCRELGIDVVVLDNKKVNIRQNYTYINPNQSGCSYKYKELSISALTFKLMQSIAIYYNVRCINKYLDLIFIGEQSAMAPINDENAIVLKEGMEYIINTKNYGLRAILDYYNVVEPYDSFILKIIELITPIISAVGMMDNARIIIELLITDRKERAEQITKYLNKSKITV